MPIRRLPSELIKKLHRTAPKLEAVFHRLKTKDHRIGKNDPALLDAQLIRQGRGGMLVRGLRVNRQFPHTRIVLKWDQNGNARGTISAIAHKVRAHNQRPHSGYYVVGPKAYAISQKIIAMHEVNFPSIEEVIGNASVPSFGKTKRGHAFLKRVSNTGLTAEEIRRCADIATSRLDLNRKNIIIIGVEKGKPIFMPLLDLSQMPAN